MKRLFILSIILTITFSAFSQAKVDTLVIGSREYPLKKSKIFRVGQTGPVDLPSEYEKFVDYTKNTKIDYTLKSDTIDIFELLDDGSEVWVKKTPCKNTYSDNSIYLFSFADTVKLSYKEFANLKPYIKTNGSKIYFCASKISCIRNDTLNEVFHRNMTNGQIFASSYASPPLSNPEINKIKQTTFVLQNLYYLKNNTTFYLDREFIILVK